jgi:hypothetical protein
MSINNKSFTNGTVTIDPTIPLENNNFTSNAKMMNTYQTPVKNLAMVKKFNSYRKKFIIHEPSDSEKDEISFDLKSLLSEGDEEDKDDEEEEKYDATHTFEKSEQQKKMFTSPDNFKGNVSRNPESIDLRL